MGQLKKQASSDAVRQKSRSPVPPAPRSPQHEKKPKFPTPKAPGKKANGYGSEGVKDNDVFLLPGTDYQILVALMVVGTVVRLFRIYQPSSVVFDEVHFGGFASKYINGKFFMDVHPPLAKLLITLAGWLAGFDGSFDFKDIGKDYVEPKVPYVAMRMLPAILGILTIPTMFLTLKASGCKTVTATLGAALIIFENGLITQSRLILLDSPLVICTAFTALAWTSFTNQHELGPAYAFQPTWWFWLAATGLGLGATVSVKWVGLFTIAWVGSLTLLQLWVLLGESQTITTRKWFKHFFARLFCLVVLPVAFYMSMFAIHFLCLVNPGDGDGFMSSEFQATLNNKGMSDVPADVLLGSEVTFRHWNTQGGYLHSHLHMYPTGSKQQQITLYPHKDDNNIFVMENSTQPITTDNYTVEGIRAWANLTEYVQDGTVVKMYHTKTHRRLHSHDQKPPVTEADWQFEVTAYGYEGFPGDANDLFRVEIIPHLSDGEIAKKRVRTIQTKFRLVHVMTGCVLFSHKVKLPSWGFEQQEVTCAKGATLPNSVWYIEQNSHPLLGDSAEKVNYRKPGFLGKFWELQKVMWKTNAGLTESHTWDSRPPSWPLLQRGINFWGKNHRQIYLIGNPAIWWPSTVAILLYVAFKAVAVLRWQRSYSDYSNVTFKRFDYEIGQTVLGWAFHYFPFFLMARQLFLHHYFPALYFAIMALCQIYDFATVRVPLLGSRLRPEIGWAGAALFIAFAIGVFSAYAPLTYGNPWTQDACKSVKLFEKWDFDCNTFHTDYAKYAFDKEEVGDVKPTQSPVQSSIAPPSESVTPQPEPPKQVPRHPGAPIGHEEHIEYRDQDGNLLNPEQVAFLMAEGKASFETKYETRTRMVDEYGNVVNRPEGVAPPHPDIEGQNPDTKGTPEKEANSEPAEAKVSPDVDANAENQSGKPKPASEQPRQATSNEEKPESKPVSESVVEAVAAAQESAQEVKEQIKEAVQHSVVEPIQEIVNEPVVEEVKEQVQESIVEPAKETVTEPVKEQVQESIVEPVKESFIEPVKEQVQQAMKK